MSIRRFLAASRLQHDASLENVQHLLSHRSLFLFVRFQTSVTVVVGSGDSKDTSFGVVFFLLNLLLAVTSINVTSGVGGKRRLRISAE